MLLMKTTANLLSLLLRILAFRASLMHTVFWHISKGIWPVKNLAPSSPLRWCCRDPDDSA